MKKTTKKSNNKFIIAINLFLIAILMVVAVYAWFASHADNRVDAYDIQVESDSALEMSFDGKTWGGTLNLADYKISDANVLESMKFVEVTGDGTNFQIPKLIQKQNYAEVNTEIEWDDAKANEDYLQFTLYLRSKEKLDVYLSSESKASPASAVVTGEGCGNPSTYASGEDTFSKDCIVGSLRVAVKDDSDVQKFIWITNPNFHLNNTIGSNTYSMTTDAESGDFTTDSTGVNFYWNDPYTHYYYDSARTRTTASTSDVIAGNLPDTITNGPNDDNAKTKIASLKKTTEGGEFFTSQATVTIWIEGCDTESRRALVDGKFNLSLVLDAFSVQ